MQLHLRSGAQRVRTQQLEVGAGQRSVVHRCRRCLAVIVQWVAVVSKLAFETQSWQRTFRICQRAFAGSTECGGQSQRAAAGP